MTTTIAKMRAQRARELQTELQALGQFRRESRAHIAAIAKAWRPLSKRLTRALERMNRVLPDELQLADAIASPNELTDSLTDTMAPTWDFADVLAELRELGPKLKKIAPAKVRNKRAKVTAAKAAAQKFVEKYSYTYEQMQDDLDDPTRFGNRLHNANLGQRMDGKPEYTEASYRKQLKTWLGEYAAKRREAGL